MKSITLIVVGACVVALGLGVFLYFAPGTNMYRPNEKHENGSVGPMPMIGRYTEYLDKMEAVLKRELIRYKRPGPWQLYFHKMPSPERIRELEAKAGIPSP